jgi:heme exporter protein CcmD
MLADLLGRHGGFILASYLATAAIMGGVAWASVRRYIAARRRLARTPGAEHG